MTSAKAREEGDLQQALALTKRKKKPKPKVWLVQHTCVAHDVLPALNIREEKLICTRKTTNLVRVGGVFYTTE